jgi:VIT1/CCC1 family predicted Fe2+/Mn2+ transporter
LVFGFGDGVNTSLGIVAGVGGAAVSPDIVILAALIGMFTGAKAMAVQNYLAAKSQREILESEIKREEFEIENVPDKERQEIEDIYLAKGFRGDELKRIVNKITSNKDVWLKTMLNEELGLNLPYFVVKTGIISSSTAIGIAIGLSLTSSFIVGAIKSRIAKRNWIKGGIEMSALGTGVALVGYGIGSELSKVGLVSVQGG